MATIQINLPDGMAQAARSGSGPGVSRAKSGAILEQTNISREGLLADVRRLAEVIVPPRLPRPVCRDPDDDEVLALAIAAKVELIVSGDNDLLSLGRFAGVRIAAVPAEAVIVSGAPGSI